MRQIYKAFVLLALISVKPAFAGGLAQDVHFVGQYGFTWEGIPLASAELSVEQGKDAYSLRLAIESKGIVNLFTRHRSDTSAHGRRDGDKYLPEAYESHYWTKNKPRHIKLAFDSKGAVTEELVEPPEDHKERPIVPHSLKDGALDPLTLLLAVRRGDGAPKVFDGKHLWEGKAVPIPFKEPPEFAGHPAMGYILSRKPLAGMTAKETKEYEAGEPLLQFFFTADAAKVPLYMTLPVMLGRLTGSLIKECKTWDECRVN